MINMKARTNIYKSCLSQSQSILSLFSTSCEHDLCSDCEPTWVTCQDCGRIQCGHCSQYSMHVCSGKGCSRANCNGCDKYGCNYDGHDGCMEGKVGSVECVTACWDLDNNGIGCCGKYCIDCRVEKCKSDGFGCANCAQTVAPSLVEQIKMLRMKQEK